mmetsp:Transcript_24192/g.48398  ORF Transcript_24192/g.48398 Transcript_24192/m.48398 type:complete len:305 (+) Transcript_24192:54-968(+)
MVLDTRGKGSNGARKIHMNSGHIRSDITPTFSTAARANPAPRALPDLHDWIDFPQSQYDPICVYLTCPCSCACACAYAWCTGGEGPDRLRHLDGVMWRGHKATGEWMPGRRSILNVKCKLLMKRYACVMVPHLFLVRPPPSPGSQSANQSTTSPHCAPSTAACELIRTPPLCGKSLSGIVRSTRRLSTSMYALRSASNSSESKAVRSARAAVSRSHVPSSTIPPCAIESMASHSSKSFAAAALASCALSPDAAIELTPSDIGSATVASRAAAPASFTSAPSPPSSPKSSPSPAPLASVPNCRGM